MAHSPWLANHQSAKNAAALTRIEIAMARLPNILERNLVCCQKTLEQKISDQGPNGQRVDPHLLGIALKELVAHRKILSVHHHPATGNIPWYANARTSPAEINTRLSTLAPLYNQVSNGAFPNLVGDALEVVVQETLISLNQKDHTFNFLGALQTRQPKNRHGRFNKIEPPNVISGHASSKIPDFYLSGFNFGLISIECKNLREWVYPHHALIKDLIQKALETNTSPLLVARRIHYTTISNLLEPAGIMAHESYYQYYPSEHAELASKVAEKDNLGFSDIRATETPNIRTVKFFNADLPKIADSMAAKFRSNHKALSDFVAGEINLAQLYNAIGSPAAGNWRDFPELNDTPY